jgi:CheY-like chemotaxis protein
VADETLLVVDDDPSILRLLELSLAAEGYRVLTAPDGDTGLARIPEHPDLVILDVMMPRVDGLEVLRRLRADPDPATAAIPVLLLSARATASDIEKGRAAGADGHLGKPFDQEALLERVASLLAR